MKTLMKNLANLVKVKTMVTLLLTIVFCVLALNGTITGGDFLTVFMVIIAFYFSSQSEKRAEEKQVTEPTESPAIPAQTQAKTETVDAAMMNEVHPPEQAN